MEDVSTENSDINIKTETLTINEKLREKDNNHLDISAPEEEDISNNELNLKLDEILENNKLMEDQNLNNENSAIDHSIITDKILDEERKLEQKALEEEEKIKQEMLEKYKKEEEEKCLKRLHLLLSRSSIYAKFMAEKLQQHEITQKKKKTKKLNLKEIENKESSDLRKNQSVKRKAETSSPLSSKKQKSEIFMDVLRNENLSNLTVHESQNEDPIVNHTNNSNSKDIANTHPALFYGGEMRPYQIDGYDWLKSLYENGVNGILADEMGLGKTIQAIAFVAYLIEMGIPGPFFVCAPLSTIPNWFSEFKRFTPDIPVLLYHGNSKEREMIRTKIAKKVTNGKLSCFPVVITSYQIALIDAKKFSRIEWKILVIDEAHRIKNFECRLIKALKQYRAAHRLLLTGTPLQNNLTELWSLLNFILPEIFDDLKAFQSWFDINVLSQSNASKDIIAIEQEKQIVSTIHQILTPFLLRRTKADVELQLPPKKEIIVHAPLTNLQQKYYSAVLNKTIDKIVNATNIFDVTNALPSKRISKRTEVFGCESDIPVNVPGLPDIDKSDDSEENVPSLINLKMQNTQMALRKICNHPYLISCPLKFIDEQIVKASGKLIVLDLMLSELYKRGHKVIIFSQFTSMLDILEDYLSFRKYKYSTLTGSMSLSDRQEELEAFKDESVFVFLISTKAGGLGLNIVSADTVIIYDSDWNPQNDLQAQDRCHRIGQTKPVVVYRLVVKNTIDERIMDFSDAKRKLEKVIIRKGRFTSKNMSQSYKALTKEELLELLESDQYNFVETDVNVVLPPEELEKILDRSNMI